MKLGFNVVCSTAYGITIIMIILGAISVYKDDTLMKYVFMEIRDKLNENASITTLLCMQGLLYHTMG